MAQRTGQRDHALADLSHAIELAPDGPAPRDNRAVVLKDAGRWGAALADLDVATKLAPDDPDIGTARAECLAGIAA